MSSFWTPLGSHSGQSCTSITSKCSGEKAISGTLATCTKVAEKNKACCYWVALVDGLKAFVKSMEYVSLVPFNSTLALKFSYFKLVLGLNLPISSVVANATRCLQHYPITPSAGKMSINMLCNCRTSHALHSDWGCNPGWSSEWVLHANLLHICPQSWSISWPGACQVVLPAPIVACNEIKVNKKLIKMVAVIQLHQFSSQMYAAISTGYTHGPYICLRCIHACLQIKLHRSFLC